MFALRLVAILSFVALIQVQAEEPQIEDNPCKGLLLDLCVHVLYRSEIHYSSDSIVDCDFRRTNGGLAICAVNGYVWFTCYENPDFFQFRIAMRYGGDVKHCALAKSIKEDFLTEKNPAALIQAHHKKPQIEDNTCKSLLLDLCVHVLYIDEMHYHADSIVNCDSPGGFASCAVNGFVWFSCFENPNFFQFRIWMRNGADVKYCALAKSIKETFLTEKKEPGRILTESTRGQLPR